MPGSSCWSSGRVSLPMAVGLELDDLQGFFQLKPFCDTMILLKKGIWSRWLRQERKGSFLVSYFSWENIWVLMSCNVNRLECKIKTIAIMGR